MAKRLAVAFLMTASVSLGLHVLPPIRRVSLEGSSRVPVSSELRFVLNFAKGAPSPDLRMKLEEAIEISVGRVRSGTKTSAGIQTISIHYTGGADGTHIPSVGTNEAYELRWKPESIDISAASLSGVIYALESVSQLISLDGLLPARSGTLVDSPRFAHRGLLVDTGRRFWPLSLLKQTVEAMSAVKLNVLHFHFTDNCRFAVQSDSHPELTPADGQLLTKADVRDLIEFAAVRGVRVVPEIDLPGHARGMRNANGVTWANERRVQMTDSRGTRAFLHDILSEFADLFPDEFFHIGADETSNAPKDLIDFAIALLRAKGKRVVGWEESHFVSGAGDPRTLTVQLWKSVSVTKAKRFQTIYSDYRRFYLDLRPETERLWVDINPSGENVLGGEVAMWTDAYCPLVDCHETDKPIPIANQLFAKERDAEFANSIHRMVWTKSAVAASALWNFHTEFAPAKHLGTFQQYLLAKFGIRGCVDTNSCRCSELSGCGEEEEARQTSAVRSVSSPPSNSPPSSSFMRNLLGELSAPLAHPVVMFALDESGPTSSTPSGIFLTKFTSWLGPNPGILADPRLRSISGDIAIYYVDAYYSGAAFSSDQVEAFLLRLRRVVGSGPTVSLIYDDGGKKDIVLFREYVKNFNRWLARIDRNMRGRIGKVALGLNVESLSAAAIAPVVSELIVRSDLTKFQIIVYGSDAERGIVELGLRQADSLLVHIAGDSSRTIVANALAFATTHAALLEASPPGASVTFAVKSASVREIGEQLFATLPKRKCFSLNRLVMIHPWEAV